MRHLFGGSPADFAMERVGNQLQLRPFATGTVWDAATDGTAITDLADLSTNPITQVTANSDGSVSFYGPDGVTLLYVDFGYGRRYAMTATDTGPILTDFIADGGEPGGWAQLNGSGKLDSSQVDPTWFETYAPPNLVAETLSVTGSSTVDDLDVQGDLDVSGTLTPANLQMSSMRIYNPKVYGALGNGTGNDATAINAALSAASAAGGGWVIVPSGTYMIGSIIRIYGNTRLTLMPGTEFRRNYAGTMLLNGDAAQSLGGYTGHGNILIEGGLWNMRATTSGLTGSAMCISIGHAKGVTIRDLEIRDTPGFHAIELNSTKNALIDNCRFAGYADPGGRDFSEAIQLDLAKSSGVFGGFGPYDNTVCEDVEIRGCYVGPSGTAGTTAWPRGIGSHSATVGTAHHRTRIIGNTFEGLPQYPIVAYAWDDTVIEGNTIKGCGGGIRARSIISADAADSTNLAGVVTNASQTMRNLVIANNTVRDTGSVDDGILLYGESTGRIHNATITGNVVDTVAGGENGIRLFHVEQYTVSGNTIREPGGTAISQEQVFGGTVSGNRLYQPGGSGISCDTGQGVTIGPNTMRNLGTNGIHILGGSDIQLLHNLIKGASRSAAGNYGIRASTAVDGLLVVGNRVRPYGSGNEAAWGLSITNTCTNVRRYGNDLTGSGTSGTVDDQSTTPDINPQDEGVLTYTPTVTNGGTATFTTQTARYYKLGKMVWVNIGLVVNAAGSGASNLAVALPSTPSRTIQQTLDLTCESVRVASQSTKGSAVILTTGSGATIDRLRNQVAATGDGTTDNRILNVQGAHLLAGAIVTITGWYQEA